MAVADQRMHLGLGDAVILTRGVRAAISLGGDSFGCAAVAFDFVSGPYRRTGGGRGARRTHRFTAGGTVIWSARVKGAWRFGRSPFGCRLSWRCDEEQSLEVSEAEQNERDQHEQGEDLL
jgi:hypothetical protein